MRGNTYTVKETHKLLKELSDSFETKVHKEVRELKKQMLEAYSAIENKMEGIREDVNSLKEWRADVEGTGKGIKMTSSTIAAIIAASSSVGGLLMHILNK